MISVIISSARPHLLKSVTENITNTIGVPFEIVAFDNSKGTKGICEIYNEGMDKAQYDLLCFVHEDVEFLTENWGEVVTTIFSQNPDIGIMGIAGSSYKPLSPSGWHGFGIRHDYGNYITTYKFTDREPDLFYKNPRNERFTPVACLDGVWLCTTKKAALEQRFDQERLKGFHGYDIDFSLGISRRHKAVVTYDVLINHFSEGRYDETWVNSIITVHKKWADILPVNLANATTQEQLYIERVTFKEFIHQLTLLKASKKAALDILLYKGRFWRFSKILFLKLLFAISKSQLKTMLKLNRS